MDLNTSVFKREHVKLSVDEVRPVPTAHNSGTKKVLSGEFSHPVMIKQVAVGNFSPGNLLNYMFTPIWMNIILFWKEMAV